MILHRVLGKKGRTTIPLSIRERLDLAPGDLLSFTCDNNAVIIRREKVCNKCVRDSKVELDGFFDALSLEEQQLLVTHLANKLLLRKGGLFRGRL